MSGSASRNERVDAHHSISSDANATLNAHSFPEKEDLQAHLHAIPATKRKRQRQKDAQETSTPLPHKEHKQEQEDDRTPCHATAAMMAAKQLHIGASHGLWSELIDIDIKPEDFPRLAYKAPPQDAQIAGSPIWIALAPPSCVIKETIRAITRQVFVMNRTIRMLKAKVNSTHPGPHPWTSLQLQYEQELSDLLDRHCLEDLRLR